MPLRQETDPDSSDTILLSAPACFDQFVKFAQDLYFSCMKPIITPQELLGLSKQPHLVLVDARTGPQAATQFMAEHLAHAVYVDLEKDLAAVPDNAAHGGRHPLPPVEAFAALLGQRGISPETHVVVYDDKGGANAAARFWWMLKAAGHTQVQVLSGGIQAALTAGFPTGHGPATSTALPSYPFTQWQLATADLEETAQASQDPHRLVIDVRDAYRYLGESEPIDPVAGHIPGAVNVPLTENLQENGQFQSPEALAEKYQSLLGDVPPEQVIVHCGSGVTACHTLLALESAGLTGAKLYVGSWSEWCRNGKPMAVGEEK